MKATIEISITVYLYQQFTTFNTGERDEIITHDNVFPDKDKAMKALAIGERKDVEDGYPFEGICGECFQFHTEYEVNGEKVWEIRRETRVREDDGWVVRYEGNRVIEKKF